MPDTPCLPATVEHVQRLNRERSDASTHWALSLRSFGLANRKEEWSHCGFVNVET
jgi:hypothetical protein